MPFGLAPVGYKKWVSEANNGTQRANIQETKCKIGALHRAQRHSDFLPLIPSSVAMVARSRAPPPSARARLRVRATRSISPATKQRYLVAIASNHGCTFSAQNFLVHEFIWSYSYSILSFIVNSSCPTLIVYIAGVDIPWCLWVFKKCQESSYILWIINHNLRRSSA